MKTPYTCHKTDTQDAVYFYEQEFYVLSNFSAFEVVIWNRTFKTAEHAYHWFKFSNTAEHISNRILLAKSAHDAFTIAQENKGLRRKDFDQVKQKAMHSIITHKVFQHPYVMKKLLETGDRVLIEDSWRDDYWGWGADKVGLNALGQLWMQVRQSVKMGLDCDKVKETFAEVKLPIPCRPLVADPTLPAVKSCQKLPNSDYIVADISDECWREVEMASGLKIRIEYPQKLIIRKGGKTHRVVDKTGVAHCYPAPETGLSVIRWLAKGDPVKF